MLALLREHDLFCVFLDHGEYRAVDQLLRCEFVSVDVILDDGDEQQAQPLIKYGPFFVEGQ